MDGRTKDQKDGQMMSNAIVVDWLLAAKATNNSSGQPNVMAQPRIWRCGSYRYLGARVFAITIL